MARANGQTWSPESGQSVLPFEPPTQKKALPFIEPGPGWLHRAEPEPLTGSAAAHWFNFALDHQDCVDDACDAYRRAIEIDPEFVDAYVNLGRLEYERGNFDEAVALYCRAANLRAECSLIRV